KTNKQQHNQYMNEIMSAYHSNDNSRISWAKIAMIEEASGFIGHMIKKHFSAFSEEYYWDLFALGKIAVLESMAGFNVEKGTLTTYFTTRILHNMSYYVNTETNKSSAYYSANMNKVRSALTHFDELMIHPTAMNLSEYTGMSIRRIQTTLELLNAVNECRFDTNAELDALMSQHAISAEEEYLKQEEHQILFNALNKLNKQDRYILCQRYGLIDGQEKSLPVIAQELHISPYKVKSSIENSIEQLKNDPELYHIASC
ncbi:MAG: sigma-70 family RNA polymerase sigma factor, partial [Lachnospiraceae bacterium]|nr:sigma-70 family RNA polymerase sigma factor [Lachnospiraceae bacterium]